MDALDPASPAVTIQPVRREPYVLGFWGTTLWGVVVFAAMFVGQLAVAAYFILIQCGSIDIKTATHILGEGITISLSVVTGLLAVLLALWLVIRRTRTPFTDYL